MQHTREFDRVPLHEVYKFRVDMDNFDSLVQATNMSITWTNNLLEIHPLILPDDNEGTMLDFTDAWFFGMGADQVTNMRNVDVDPFSVNEVRALLNANVGRYEIDYKGPIGTYGPDAYTFGTITARLIGTAEVVIEDGTRRVIFVGEAYPSEPDVFNFNRGTHRGFFKETLTSIGRWFEENTIAQPFKIHLEGVREVVRSSERATPRVPIGSVSSARMPGQMGTAPLGHETNAADVIAELDRILNRGRFGALGTTRQYSRLETTAFSDLTSNVPGADRPGKAVSTSGAVGQIRMSSGKTALLSAENASDRREDPPTDPDPHQARWSQPGIVKPTRGNSGSLSSNPFDPANPDFDWDAWNDRLIAKVRARLRAEGPQLSAKQMRNEGRLLLTSAKPAGGQRSRYLTVPRVKKERASYGQIRHALFQHFDAEAKQAASQEEKVAIGRRYVAALSAARYEEGERARESGWAEATKKDPLLAPKLTDNLVTARRALDKFGDRDLYHFLDDSGLGNHPAVIRLFYRVGEATAEDRFIRPDVYWPARP